MKLNTQASIYSRRASVSIGEYLEFVVCICMCEYVGDRMKIDEAMLLPKVYRDFVNELHTHQMLFPKVSVCVSNIPNSRWFSHVFMYTLRMCLKCSVGTVDMVPYYITRTVISFMNYLTHWEERMRNLQSLSHMQA